MNNTDIDKEAFLAYLDFINECKKNPPAEGPFEIHHIRPRSLGGEDSDSNLVNLAPLDHVKAHRLLVNCFHTDTPEWVKAMRAFSFLVSTHNKWVLSTQDEIMLTDFRSKEFDSKKEWLARKIEERRNDPNYEPKTHPIDLTPDEVRYVEEELKEVGRIKDQMAALDQELKEHRERIGRFVKNGEHVEIGDWKVSRKTVNRLDTKTAVAQLGEALTRFYVENPGVLYIQHLK